MDGGAIVNRMSAGGLSGWLGRRETGAGEAARVRTARALSASQLIALLAVVALGMTLLCAGLGYGLARQSDERIAAEQRQSLRHAISEFRTLFGRSGDLDPRFLRLVERSAGLKVGLADFTDLAAVEAAIRPDTRMLWVETPTNPLLKVVDLEGIVALAKRKGLLTVADNTFCSPYLQRPLELGVDIVVHSTTKYLNGHSDMVGGVAVVREEGEILNQLKFLQNAVGAISGPFDSFLALRGLKTLALRMERHSQNGMRIAKWLEGRKDVRRVIYPGLPSHPQHTIAKRQMSAFGGMISVELDRDLAATKRFLERTQLFALAESLGGVESLIEHPALMTHGSIPAEQRAAIGISDSLVRLSAGIEDADDLIADLEQALAV